MRLSFCILFVVAILAAASYLLIISLQARAGTQTLIGRDTASHGLSWFARGEDGMIPVQQAADNEAAPPAETQSAGLRHGAIGPVLLAALPSSGALGAFSDEEIITGSLGAQAFRFAPREDAPAPRLPLTAPREDTRPLPLPRMRPQLAALPPADFRIGPEGETLTPRTAIYDISAKTVYMPNGERLEAHSGLGEHMDDPRYVRLRMRGVTPPNAYRLTMREALFHGTEALRMTPEDPGRMYGRNGILAHPYLMGSSGQSNGCVSFKDYGKFLAAFKRGEVDRMIVVFRSDKQPAAVAQRTIWNWWKTL